MNFELKNLADLKGTHYFGFPFIVMRRIMNKEQFLLESLRNAEAGIFGFSFISFIIGTVAVLTQSMSLFYTATALFLLFVPFCLFFKRKHTLKLKELQPKDSELAAFENLELITPFIIFNKEQLEIYDNKGVLVKRFKTEIIKDIRYWDNGNSRYRERGFKITFKGKIFENFIYNVTRQEYFTNTFYIEYDNSQYYIGGYIWFMSNILDMLKKDPNAEQFPFRRKNYINGRKWDEP